MLNRAACRLLAFGMLLSVAPATAWATPAQVIIIRHAEKDDGGDLSTKGYQRADALVGYFTKKSELLRFGTPVAIYATDPKHEDSSHRQIETVEPLARALHLKVLHPYTKKEIQPLVDEILGEPAYDGKSVLISWSHNQIPDIAAELGAEDAPTSWDDNTFDRTWVLTFKGDKVASFSDLPQRLLPGDAD